MVEIEPYNFQKKTNIKEHNDIVYKINEIVNVINNAELEGIGSRLDAIDSTNTLQWKDIESIKSKDTEQDSTLATHATEIDGITKSLVSDVAILNGTTSGNVKVRIGLQDAPSIDSDDYNIQKPTSVELIQGSAPAMVKAQITLSDGTVLISDDFMFTTEAIGQDVYISSFVFKNGNVAGTISADIGLSNGSTLTANNFAVPTDPNVLSSIADLTSRTEALEQVDIGALKTTVDGHTASINALDSDVADLQINKADVTNTEQIITNKRVDTEIVRYKYNATDAYGIQGTGTETDPFLITGKKTVAGKEVYVPIGKIATLDSDGNPTNFTSGGEEWEEVNLSNFPTDWVANERIKVQIKPFVASTSLSPYKWSTPPSNVDVTVYNNPSVQTFKRATVEISISDDNTNGLSFVQVPISIDYSGLQYLSIITIKAISSYTTFNSGGTLFTIEGMVVNGGGIYVKSVNITSSNLSSYVEKIYRLKK